MSNKPNTTIVMYTTDDGMTKVKATFDNDTVWLSIDQMAELFQRDKSTISRHIKNVFAEGELSGDSVVANFAITAAAEKIYQVDYYKSVKTIYKSCIGLSGRHQNLMLTQR